jgi:hypothetical protein
MLEHSLLQNILRFVILSHKLVLHSSVVLSFHQGNEVGIRHLLWLLASAHCLTHTNEQRCAK